MMTLGDHLGPDEDVDLPGPKRREQGEVGSPTSHRVPVHSRDDGFRHELLYLLFHPLGPKAPVVEEGAPAIGALADGTDRGIAPVAPGGTEGGVVGQAHRTV